MPQFDTFSFLSQLFWVFSIFCLFYTALAYYLLPAVAITLKIRRRKLSFLSPSLSADIAASKSDFVHTLNISLEQTPKEKQIGTDTSEVIKSVDILNVEKLTFKAFATNLSTKITGLILQR